MFERTEVWDRLNWSLDRTQFVRQLDVVRRARNRLMHFVEGDIPDELGLLDRFAQTLSVLHVK